MAAEGRVFEEARDELVVLDLEDVLLLEGPLPGPDHAPSAPGSSHSPLDGGRTAGAAVVVVGVVVVPVESHLGPLVVVVIAVRCTRTRVPFVCCPKQ